MVDEEGHLKGYTATKGNDNKPESRDRRIGLVLCLYLYYEFTGEINGTTSDTVAGQGMFFVQMKDLSTKHGHTGDECFESSRWHV